MKKKILIGSISLPIDIVFTFFTHDLYLYILILKGSNQETNFHLVLIFYENVLIIKKVPKNHILVTHEILNFNFMHAS